MTGFNKRAPWLLLVGDVAAFVASLWLALAVRYVAAPDRQIFFLHLAPFSLLFAVWAIVFFISGLYDRRASVFARDLSADLVRAQIVNIAIAIAFFYAIPWYGISPKTTLFIYLLISLALVLGWRIYGYPALVPKSRERAAVLGEGAEARDLALEMGKGRPGSGVSFIDLSQGGQDVVSLVRSARPTLVVADLHDAKVQSILPRLYGLLFDRVQFVDLDRMYEEVFGRIPLSVVKHHWFLENVSTSPKILYDSLKRAMDIIVSAVLGLVSFVAYPFVAVAIKMEDGGPIFIRQGRVGKNDRIIRIVKFRSMTLPRKGEDGNPEPQRVTRVGSFIRKTRIDELPQLWNVLKGDLSLIGPRPELPDYVKIYEGEIPFYKIRHLIKPGLSGWAQVYHETPPKFAASREDTAMKLSYDLYYVKNRSLPLDLHIALKTIREIVSRHGV